MKNVGPRSEALKRWGRKSKVSDEALNRIVEMYRAGKTLAEIARSIGVHRTTVSYWVEKLIEEGVLEPRGYIDKELIRRLVEHGLTDREIASILGVSRSTVSWWRRRLGLPPARHRSVVVIAHVAVRFVTQLRMRLCREGFAVIEDVWGELGWPGKDGGEVIGYAGRRAVENVALAAMPFLTIYNVRRDWEYNAAATAAALATGRDKQEVLDALATSTGRTGRSRRVQVVAPALDVAVAPGFYEAFRLLVCGEQHLGEEELRNLEKRRRLAAALLKAKNTAFEAGEKTRGDRKSGG